MEIKAKDMCPRCKYCLGMTSQGMYSCGKANDDSELNIGIDVILNCANFEWKDEKAEGKVLDFCPKCKNCKGVTKESNGVHVWLTEVECEDPYDGMTKTLTADSDICCSMFEVMEEKELFNLNMPREAIKAIAKLNDVICELEKEKSDHLKSIERLKKSQEKLQNQVKNLQTTNEESYKREEKLEDKVHKLERRLLEENKRFARLDSEFLIRLARVLYPREAKICKPYSEVIEDIKRLVDKSEILEQRYDNIHYTLYKDWSDDSISCPRDIPSDVEMIEDLKKRAADSDYYKEKSELLDERNNNQFNTIREKNNDIDHLISLNKELDKKISELEKKCHKADSIRDAVWNEAELNKKISELKARVEYWSNKAVSRSEELTEAKKDRDKWKRLYNSLSETCADYDKRCKEECEKKYRDEISKLQNIVTEKHVEIKGLKKDIIDLSYDRRTVESMSKKNTKLNQTISDQEITIKALLITIKEMCKDE